MKSALTAFLAAFGLSVFLFAGCDHKAQVSANANSLVPTCDVHFAGQTFTTVEIDLGRVELNLYYRLGNFYLKPNGVFLIDGQGARVVDAAKYSASAANVHLAVQSGPLLVIGGQIHPKFDPHSLNERIRSGVGVVLADRVIFAISREHEYSAMLGVTPKTPGL